ncbi:Beta-lactamase [Nitrobacter hamburgensis X14]|uniref:Beta-lactamase n=1 Tax=Nitrobacter hamburgensis (strain DSM 10229 / NCIMB 13809 / X14) TaxID=323097 RepID=Q1QR11_NITHX|nr:class A beta-lactamase [Nitrobacter hamburgensis]ABE61336.1 Beta-lactamase [Nitrobacter hamburgensis X14]
MIGRRRLLRAAGAGLVGLVVMSRAGRVRAAPVLQERFVDELKRLETESGGRLGVTLLDTGTGQCVGHRMDERFPLCSTFKVLASGAVLQGVDAGKESLARRIYFNEADLVTHSPETHKRVGPIGITVAELCKAAITLSDNTAGNLLLASIGGPQGLTAFVRKLGDDVTRLDRIETELNEAAPGDPRDTTTPNAMASDLRALAVGDVLSAKSRAQLVGWLAANTTGGKRLRAGLPAGWRVGDKTGTGERGTANDVAVIWPPDRAPFIITAYLTGATVSADRQNAVMAAVGRAVATALA